MSFDGVEKACGCQGVPGSTKLCSQHYAEQNRLGLITKQETERPTNTPNPEAHLQKAYPHGHPRFLPITLSELQLHSEKNHDYANGGDPLGNFDRVAAILALYPQLPHGDRRVVALVYALKQLDAVLWGLNSGIVHKIEGANSRLQDISVYMKLIMCMNEDTGQEGK